MNITVNNTPVKGFNFLGGECQVSNADIAISDITGIKAYLYRYKPGLTCTYLVFTRSSKYILVQTKSLN